MSAEAANEIAELVKESLGRMSAADREKALGFGMAELEAWADQVELLPEAEQKVIAEEFIREIMQMSSDIAGRGPAEMRRYAEETAQRLRGMGEANPRAEFDERERVEDAAERGTRHHKAFRACRHVLAGGPAIGRWGAILCISHPEQGVRCLECNTIHVTAQHDPAEERTCDGCRAEVQPIWPVTFMGPTSFRAVGLNRKRKYVAATLAIAGVGFCEDCRDERGDQLQALDDRMPNPFRKR